MLLISLDTLRADRLEAYGSQRPTSPSLNAFASRSVVFDDARAQASQTAPSHASLFSSTSLAVHGVINVHGDTPRVHKLPSGVTTLAEVVSERGWETAAFVSGGNLSQRMDLNRGFDTWDERFENVTERSRAALSWMLKPGRGPFFTVLHTYQVHAPYLPPRELADRFVDPAYSGPLRERLDHYLALPEKAAWEAAVGPAYWEGLLDFTDEDVRFLSDLYDAEIAHLDESLRIVFETVMRGELGHRLAIVILSDHGEEFRDHGKYQHDQIFEEHLHVPLMIKLPPKLERSGWTGRVQTPVSLIDVAPTVLEVLGLSADGLPWQGRSLMPLLGPDREKHEGGELSRPVFSQLVVEPGPQYHRSVVFNDWKYIRVWHENIDHTREWLFNLSNDPGERRNLIDVDHSGAPKVLATLRELLEQQGAQDADLARRVGDGITEALDAEGCQRLRALGYVGDC
ncbi:MAG: hypothetical protein DHS20C15_04600 [Planctomycetota bacterium]|nr:MAG: hypothetical protein DHS20C15_04600 [Planctomycetota bacterium]